RYTAQYQPGLVAIPHRRDGVHDEIARRRVRCQSEENADAQVEAVEHDVVKDADRENQCPEWHQVRHDLIHAGPSVCGVCSAERGIASTGCSGRPLSMISGRIAGSLGPRCTLRHMKPTPTGYMSRYT